ncbi:MAG: DUF4126 domain-containing protein [Deltaproteobacteria bacterium]|nr:DUF4126 domain-containing protein [Deltaproteobacteria bacterium]
MDTVKTLATLLPLALTSGFNLYLTVLVAGLCVRFGVVTGIPESMQVLGSWPVLTVAGLFFMLEFLADKVNWVDNVWDAIHTFVRPVGAAVLGVAALGSADPAVAVLAALAAGSVALVSHGGKAGGRAALNILSPFETATNIGVSLVENVFVGVLAYLAIKHPYLAAGIALVVLVLLIVFVPMLLRWAWLTLRAVVARLKGFVSKVETSYTLPASHLALLEHKTPEIAAICKAQKVRGAGGRSGYLSLSDGVLSFTFDKWFSPRIWSLSRQEIKASYVRRKILIDMIEVHYDDKKGRARLARFVFLKDRAPLLDQIAQKIAAQPAK